MTTPPERSSKLSPRWKGRFRVCRIPNDYQIVYEDGEVHRMIHINHTKPAKLTAPDLPEPIPAPETPRPPLGYLPAGLLRPRPPPPASAAPAGVGTPPLPQQHQPPLSQPLPLRARCNRPQPRQPISGQNPFLVHNDLPDSTLSLAKCVL